MQRCHALSIGSLATLMLSASCSSVHELTGTLQDLQAVQGQLVRVLGHNEIRVLVNNGHFLSIRLVNSPLQDLPPDRKKAKALEIARLAYNGYRSRSDLKSVTVTFAVHRSYLLGFFTYYDSTDSFNFQVPNLTPEHTPQ
jgi:hypothetical protein